MGQFNPWSRPFHICNKNSWEKMKIFKGKKDYIQFPPQLWIPSTACNFSPYAIAILTSVRANLIATQFRGPDPNEIQSKGVCLAFSSFVNLWRWENSFWQQILWFLHSISPNKTYHQRNSQSLHHKLKKSIKRIKVLILKLYFILECLENILSSVWGTWSENVTF